MNYPILIITPSLDRPQGLQECLNSLIQHSTGLADYFAVTRRTGGWIRALNSIPLSLIAQYDVVGIINDDVRMRTPGWDKIVYEHLRDKIGLVYGRDGIQDQRLCTQPFISAQAIVRAGHIAPWCMEHSLVDNYWWEIFRAVGGMIYDPQLFTEHLHVSAGKSNLDSTYRLGQDAWPRDWARWPKFCAEELPRVIAKVRGCHFYSECGEDQWLFEHGMIPVNGVYVDVGAAFPQKDSNTAFLRDLGWTGIQIDGNPGYAPQWTSQGKSLIVAVVWNEEEAAYQVNQEKPNLSKIVSSGTKVPARPLNDILRENGIGKIDLLSLDVEGAEYPILSTLDFSRHCPSIIIWEYNTLGVKDERLAEFLEKRGYACVHKTECNYIHAHASVRSS